MSSHQNEEYEELQALLEQDQRNLTDFGKERLNDLQRETELDYLTRGEV